MASKKALIVNKHPKKEMLMSEPSAMATENDFDLDFEFIDDNHSLKYPEPLTVNSVPNEHFLTYISP